MSDQIMDEKLFEIIEIARKQPYCSLDYLAESLGVSTRSIRNYIKQINSDLDDIASLVKEKGKGYKLEIVDEHSFQLFLEKNQSDIELLDTPKRRISFIIDRLINSEVAYTLDDLAFEMSIGRTTLVNELKKASVSLETYNLKIHGKQNIGMTLSGKELDLRLFILDNIYDVLYQSYPLDEDISEELLKIFHSYDLESVTQKKLMEFIIIMLDRLLKGHQIEEIQNKHRQLLNTQDYQIAKEIVKALENQLPVEIPEKELFFITIPIAGRRTPTNNRMMTDFTITDDVKKLLEQIVEQLGFNKEIINDNEQLFVDLQYHLTFMLNRLLFGLRLKNPLLVDVKGKYPVAYKMAEIAGQVIESNMDIKVSEDELGYLAFYFGVFISQSDDKVKRFQKVAVVCGTGRGTARLIAIQLERILKQETKIDLYSDIDVTEEVLNHYDLIFSTVKLSYDTTNPLIMINEIFDENTVKKEIEKTLYMQKSKVKRDNVYLSVIAELITEEKFFILDSTKDYHDNVNSMVHSLIQSGHLDNGFTERLRERETKGSMVFDNYVALPHTFNQFSTQIELALGIFPETVIADGKELKLVFLLGLPEQQTDNNEYLIVKIYDEIIRIANDKQLIEKMSTAENYSDIIQLLESGL